MPKTTGSRVKKVGDNISRIGSDSHQVDMDLKLPQTENKTKSHLDLGEYVKYSLSKANVDARIMYKYPAAIRISSQKALRSQKGLSCCCDL